MSDAGPAADGVCGMAGGYRIARVTASMRERAAERLVSASTAGPASARSAARRFLSAAAEHGVDLEAMFASHEGDGAGDRPRQVVLSVKSEGRTATFFTTTPRDEAEASELASVLDRACRELVDVRLAQALLTPAESSVRGAFNSAGFSEICWLAYLSGPLLPAIDGAKKFVGGAWPEGIEVVRCVGVEDDELLVALRRSYERTLDCPELCAMRDPADVLASHRDSGVYDPSRWWLMRRDGEPVGVAFVSRNPAQGAVELVYLGIAPEVRGLGLGRRLLSRALVEVSGVPERLFQCAVDLRNGSAIGLYEGFGLREVARRLALVRGVEDGGSRRDGVGGTDVGGGVGL